MSISLEYKKMITLKKLKEEVDLAQNVRNGDISVDKNPVRENINNLLTNALSSSFVTPYVGLEKVSKVLANFHMHLPKVPFLEGNHGVQVFDLNQFGEMMGMKNDGTVVTKVETPYHVYFEYQMNDKGRYDIFCEVVDDEELDELLGEMEDDMNDVEDEREKKLDENLLKTVAGLTTISTKPEVQNMSNKDKELNEEGKKGTYRPGMSSPRNVDIANAAKKADRALDIAYGYGTSGNISPIAATRRKQGFGAAANYNSAEFGIRAASRSNNLRSVSNAVHKGWGKTVDELPAPNPEKQESRKKLKRTAYSKLSKPEQEKDDVIARVMMNLKRKK